LRPFITLAGTEGNFEGYLLPSLALRVISGAIYYPPWQRGEIQPVGKPPGTAGKVSERSVCLLQRAGRFRNVRFASCSAQGGSGTASKPPGAPGTPEKRKIQVVI